jgi:Alpha/beta hydrolase domain
VLFGQTTPLTPTQLSALYPTHHKFVQRWTRAVRDARRAAYLLPEDADKLIEAVGG